MQGLADIARRWRDMFPEGGPEDSRLKPLVTSLATRSLASDYSAATAKFAGGWATGQRSTQNMQESAYQLHDRIA